MLVHPRRRGTATSFCPYNSHPDILDLFAPDFYIVGFDRPQPHGPAGDARYHELLMTNFDPGPMLNRQLSLLDNPGLESSDRPELRILSVSPGPLAVGTGRRAYLLRIRGENRR